jgi:hypothetical protein
MRMAMPSPCPRCSRKARLSSASIAVFGARISDAGEVMAAVQTAMLAELPYPRLRDAVIAHLTIAEGLGFLLANVPPRSAVA